MMLSKPKSAPGRLPQSRLAKNRTNATKEIQAWAKRADETATCHASSRMSGQLSDNVTEERMLRAKLWELSKERYKFLMQNAYEKKIFADRMRRRSIALFQRSLAASATRDVSSAMQQRSLAGSAVRDVSSAMHQRSLAGSAARDVSSSKGRVSPDSTQKSGLGRPSARSRNSQRLTFSSPVGFDTNSAQDQGGLVTLIVPRVHRAVQEHLETDQTRDGTTQTSINTDSVIEDKRAVAMSRSKGNVTPEASCISKSPAGDGSGRVILAPLSRIPVSPAIPEGDVPTKAPSGTTSRNVTFSQKSVAQVEGTKEPTTPHQGGPCNQSPAKSLPDTFLQPEVYARPSSGSVASTPNSTSSKVSKPWVTTKATPISASIFGKRRSLCHRLGMRLESKTTDPRYASLEHCLTPVQKQRLPIDVRSIVQSFDALHVQPKMRKQIKPKIHIEALKYMDERGFVF